MFAGRPVDTAGLSFSWKGFIAHASSGVARLQSTEIEFLSTKETSEEIIMTIHTLVCTLAIGVLVGCGSTIPNRSPVGELFPSVQGNLWTDSKR